MNNFEEIKCGFHTFDDARIEFLNRFRKSYFEPDCLSACFLKISQRSSRSGRCIDKYHEIPTTYHLSIQVIVISKQKYSTAIDERLLLFIFFL